MLGGSQVSCCTQESPLRNRCEGEGSGNVDVTPGRRVVCERIFRRAGDGPCSQGVPAKSGILQRISAVLSVALWVLPYRGPEALK